MIVTTSLHATKAVWQHASELAERFSLPLVPRQDASLAELRQRYNTAKILLVTAKGARIESASGESFFFHPNTASFRIKRLQRGDNDTMLAVCQIQPGDEVLDATLGLGADAIVFAYAVTERGRVVGVESEPTISGLVADGMKRWQTGSAELLQAMRRVEVVTADHRQFLASLPDDSFDVVYFDPMFAEQVDASTGISGLRLFANNHPLTAASVSHALRVARRRVVLKEGKGGTLYSQFGFTPIHKHRHIIYSYRDTDGGE